VSSSGPELAVSRSVVRDVVRLAAADHAGVLRVGRRGRWRRFLGGAVQAHVAKGGVSTTVRIVARPGVSLPATAEAVRSAVGTAIGQVLGLTAANVTVVVDGVGD
jgi:uncharacterized alkaline shock family protein YloU